MTGPLPEAPKEQRNVGKAIAPLRELLVGIAS